jgi:hypothetical protein
MSENDATRESERDMNASDKGTQGEGSATTTSAKRAWSTPRIVGTQQAFEHAILACNGVVNRTPPLPPINAIHVNSEGQCTNAATAFS